MDGRSLIVKWGGVTKFSKMTGFKYPTVRKAYDQKRITFIDKCATKIDCWLDQGHRHEDYDKREDL